MAARTQRRQRGDANSQLVCVTAFVRCWRTAVVAFSVGLRLRSICCSVWRVLLLSRTAPPLRRCNSVPSVRPTKRPRRSAPRRRRGNGCVAWGLLEVGESLIVFLFHLPGLFEHAVLGLVFSPTAVFMRVQMAGSRFQNIRRRN